MPQGTDFRFSTQKFDAEEARVLRFTATEGISECYTYDLELASFEIDVAFDDIIGEPGTLQIDTAHGHRLVHGVISRWEEVGRSKAIVYYSVRLVPRLWTLTLKRQSRIFQKMSTPQILKKVLEEANVTSDLVRMSLQGTYEERTYCVQYRESDYDFITRLMEEEGIFFFFEHGDENEVLVLGDMPDVHADLPEDPVLRYREGEAGMLSEETITQFRFARTLRTGAVALKEFDFKKPSLKLQSEKKHGSDKEKKFESYDYPGEFHVPKLGDQLAKIRLEEERAESYLGIAETDCRRMEAGWKFTMEDHPRDEMNVAYVVVRVRHVGEQPHAGGGAEGGESKKVYHAVFECIPFAIPFRPPRLTPRPRIDGPQTAIVVGPQNEEIYCDEHGRVKVKFHWDRLGAADDNASCWIRVTQPWGGEGYGSMFIPRVGQEVVVEFLEGDPDRPLVTGRVYNGTSVPPYSLPANKTITTMKSTSSPGGGGANEIAFEDKKGSEKFFVQAEKDHHVNVRNDHYESVGHDQHLTVGRDSVVDVARDSHALIERDDLVDVARDQSIKVGGKQMVHVTGSRTLKVAADVHETVGGSMSVNVGGSYYLKVGGSLVIESDADITFKVGSNFVMIDSSGVTVLGSTIKLNSGGSGKVGKAVKAVPAVKPKKATAADTAPEGSTAKGATGSLVAGAAAIAAKAAARDRQPTHKDPSPDAPPEKGKTWVEILLQDANKEPVAGEPYEVELPNKKIATGTTGADGIARIEGVDPGSCKIRFPRLDKSSWRKA